MPIAYANRIHTYRIVSHYSPVGTPILSAMLLSELMPEAKRKLYDLEQQLVDADRATSSSSYGNYPAVHISDIYLGIKEMTLQIEELERLASNEPKNYRDDSKRRVAHLRNSLIHIKSSADSIAKRKSSSSNEMMRRELMGNSYSNGFDVEGGEEGNVNAMLSENASILRSSSMVSGYLQAGSETLQELLSQRERLKGVQRKVLDMLNYLGLSNSIMRTVEQRGRIDAIIVYTGMGLVTLLIIVLWWLFK